MPARAPTPLEPLAGLILGQEGKTGRGPQQSAGRDVPGAVGGKEAGWESAPGMLAAPACRGRRGLTQPTKANKFLVNYPKAPSWSVFVFSLRGVRLLKPDSFCPRYTTDETEYTHCPTQTLSTVALEG